ncbi:MAG: type II secretion system protein [Geobacteraceae bacterium]|nr:type II secretion system protein [Geobacteraceae bacterium]NTW81234.1 type II secretion system protein [Geobacteraceae bacterium]
MNIIRNKNGFTYIFVLTIVMIMGIMLGMVGQSWKTIKQRELEEELIFRGDQVAEIVYQMSLPTGANVIPPLWPVNSTPKGILDELVNMKTVPSSGNKPEKKYRLRPSAIIDPMTNKPWKIVSPVGSANSFAGVMSESMDEPLRKSFKEIYDSKLLDNKNHYSDWQFTSELKQPLASSATQKKGQ